MSPFGNGQPERRRRDTSIPGGKRDDDPSVDVAEQFGFWARLFVKHRIKVTSLLMVLSTIGGALVTAALLAPRVAKLEKDVTVLQTDVGEIKASERTKMFILCTLLQRIDPSAVQFADGCARRDNRQTKAQVDAVWEALAFVIRAHPQDPYDRRNR